MNAFVHDLQTSACSAAKRLFASASEFRRKRSVGVSARLATILTGLHVYVSSQENKLVEVSCLALRIGLIGIGATLILDLWSFFLKTVLGVPFPNYTMVGRWIRYFPHGRFVHESIASAPAIAGEHLLGWTAHYGIGILYAGLLVVLAGVNWLNAPTVPPALIVGVVTVAAPFLVMQPAMGLGIASSKAPNPNVARLRSLTAHTVFGFGLYLSALVVTLIW